MTRTTILTIAACLVATAAATTAPSLTTPAQAANCLSYTYVPKTPDQVQKMKFGLMAYSLAKGIADADIRQYGNGNAAGIGQNGFNNTGIIYQKGDGHTGTIQQDGNNNGHVLLQLGNGATNHVHQTGNEYSASVQVGC